MKKRFLLFGITLAAMVTSCYGPNDSVYTEELDVVYTQKKDSYDFSTKTNFYVSDTVTTFDSKGKESKVPDELGQGNDQISLKEAEALVENIKINMISLGWNEVSVDDIKSDPDAYAANTVFLNSVLSKTTYVGGGYYPGYPWWGYPGYWYPWYPVYYTYSTGSAIVNMFEANTNPQPKEGAFNIIWENFLSGYIRNGIDVQYVNQGINQGFRQSQEYLAKPAPSN